MKRNEAIVFTILFSLVDVFIPVPILGLFLIYVLVARPPWFRALIDNVYTDR